VSRTEEVLTGTGICPDADVLPGATLHLLARQDWAELQDIRLVALKDSQDSFLSNYDKEFEYDKVRWLAEFDRGSWIVATSLGKPIGLLGIVRYTESGKVNHYLEYLWVSPLVRRSGIASSLINFALDRLSAEGETEIRLWVLDGNEGARKLYEEFRVHQHRRVPAVAG
jgi:ribosomal protein S18 acetylase RimI-like enzyme